jgi:hypothetical protein
MVPALMASKFQQFLTDSKIDPRRVLVASRAIERLRPEDRAIRRQKRKPADGAAAPAEGAEKAPLPKPRSGRPVTPRLLEAAIEGKKLAGPAKTRLLRAVNHLLGQKKKDPAEFRALF